MPVATSILIATLYTADGTCILIANLVSLYIARLQQDHGTS
jgi:hypothetical protein